MEMNMVLAQICMVVTLLLMISGKTPLYLTAGIGSAASALIAGFSFGGAANVTVTKMLLSGLNPVIADMTGVLMFIGVMEHVGFLDVMVKKIVSIGRSLGGGPGVAAAGGIAAGAIGALTGFTQPSITATVTGPAAVKLGVTPNEAAAISGHAGHLGNFGGFTHPTQIAVIAMAGLHFGAINLIGTFVALSIFTVTFLRLKKWQKQRGVVTSQEDAINIAAELENNTLGISTWAAFTPFLILIGGFVAGLPVFLVGMVAVVVTIILSKSSPKQSETAMLAGVGKISTPLVATITFLFMSTVIRNIGLVTVLSDALGPVLNLAPVQILLLVSALTGFMTQSYGASAAIILPMLQVVLNTGANPLAAAVAAGGGAAMMQYFLTGGPVAALATVIPVIPGSELRAANRIQRPSILVGVLCVFVITLLIR